MFRYLRVTVILCVVLYLPVISIWAQEPAPTPEPFEDTHRQDVAEYAKTYGVALDEALRRLAFQDMIGDLNHQLTTNEEEAFAGLWIEHSPTFKVIVRPSKLSSSLLGMESRYFNRISRIAH